MMNLRLLIQTVARKRREWKRRGKKYVSKQRQKGLTWKRGGWKTDLIRNVI